MNEPPVPPKKLTAEQARALLAESAEAVALDIVAGMRRAGRTCETCGALKFHYGIYGYRCPKCGD